MTITDEQRRRRRMWLLGQKMHHTRPETHLHNLVLCSIGRRETLTSRKTVGRGITSWRRNERDLSGERERERLF